MKNSCDKGSGLSVDWPKVCSLASCFTGGSFIHNIQQNVILIVKGAHPATLHSPDPANPLINMPGHATWHQTSGKFTIAT